jgi:hypothetical protein
MTAIETVIVIEIVIVTEIVWEVVTTRETVRATKSEGRREIGWRFRLQVWKPTSTRW